MPAAPTVVDPASPPALNPVVLRPAGPCRPRTTPARAARVGPAPRPRVRPLGEVLAELVRTPPESARALAPVAAPTVPAAPVVPAPDGEPATRAMVLRLLQAVVEVLDGVRPPAQLRRYCDEDLHDEVAALVPPPSVARGRSRLRGVRLCGVGPDVVEAAGVVHRPGRGRALAARLERHAGGWRFTALDVL